MDRKSGPGFEKNKEETLAAAEEQKNVQRETDRELAAELELLNRIGKDCSLKINRRDKTVTIREKRTGQILWRTTISDYEQVLDDKRAMAEGPIFKPKVLFADEKNIIQKPFYREPKKESWQ